MDLWTRTARSCCSRGKEPYTAIDGELYGQFRLSDTIMATGIPVDFDAEKSWRFPAEIRWVLNKPASPPGFFASYCW